jgi:hypothetical protein
MSSTRSLFISLLLVTTFFIVVQSTPTNIVMIAKAKDEGSLRGSHDGKFHLGNSVSNK